MNNPVAASCGDVRQPQTPASVMKVETGHGVPGMIDCFFNPRHKGS